MDPPKCSNILNIYEITEIQGMYNAKRRNIENGLVINFVLCRVRYNRLNPNSPLMLRYRQCPMHWHHLNHHNLVKVGYSYVLCTDITDVFTSTQIQGICIAKCANVYHVTIAYIQGMNIVEGTSICNIAIMTRQI
jgi:hypothetical protein